MTATMSPEAGAATAELPVLSTLRSEIQGLGNYDDFDATTDAGRTGQQLLFAQQEARTIKYVVENYAAEGDAAITPEQAVNILMEEGEPVVRAYVKERTDSFLADPATATANEIDTAADSAWEELKAKLNQKITDELPEEAEEEAAAPEDDSSSKGSWYSRISPTLKETRKAFRHWRKTGKAVRDASDDEMEAALEARKDARKHVALQVGKSLVGLTTTAFVAGNVVTNQFDRSEWITPANVGKSMAVGVVGTAAAYGVERTGIAERYRNAKIRSGMAGQNVLSRVLGGVTGGWRTEEKFFKTKKLAKKDPDASQRLNELDGKVDRGEELLTALKATAGFDESNENYKEAVTQHEANTAERDAYLGELKEKYGKKELSGKTKVVLGVGAAAVGYMVYNKIANGGFMPGFLPFYETPVDAPATNGGNNSSNTSNSVPAPSGNNSNTANTAGNTGAAGAPANPGAGKGNFNQGIYDSLPTDQAKETYKGYSDEARNSFNGMVEVTKDLQKLPKYTPWNNQYGLDVLELAKAKAEYPGGPDAFDVQWAATVGKAA